MDEKQLIKAGKFLSKALRHDPQEIGITLDSAGWVAVDTLLKAMNAHGSPLTRADLEFIVANNNKQRFAFDPAGQRIRANQGHTVAVDLELERSVPPERLYHGTGERSVTIIQREGITKMSRQHVHLSTDKETATKVGARHGKPVVFAVQASEMYLAGYAFYVSDNGVWLTDHVPPEFLIRL